MYIRINKMYSHYQYTGAKGNIDIIASSSRIVQYQGETIFQTKINNNRIMKKEKCCSPEHILALLPSFYHEKMIQRDDLRCHFQYTSPALTYKNNK
jgi:hypothetical protein